MSAEATITTAIHNIKSNRGSETPGVDFKTMRRDYLQRSHSWVIKDIQNAFRHFEPQKIRRKYIDKPGKTEKRPLGIPTIRDRIVQECMRIVLEPIFEAQFFAHSYGFRPMQGTAMALERVNYLTYHTGYYWIVEGDISKCFDHIDQARLQSFLQSKMKLILSQEKTLITDIRKKYIKFLGYEFKMVRGKSRRGYISRTIPDRDRLKRKVDQIAEEIKNIPECYSREQLIGEINRINSKVRGIIQYNQCCTWVSVAMGKHARRLQLTSMRRLKQYKGKWIPANQTQNLPHVHQQYKQKIPSVKYRDIYVGFTALTFCRWEQTHSKNQAETPYTEAGRQAYFQRTKKKRINAHLDDMYPDKTARAASYGQWGNLNNFEFIMNRAYALNRDKLKCRVCGGWLIDCTPWAHRVNPYLPLDKVNRVNNLVSLHKKCFMAVNDPARISANLMRKHRKNYRL